MRRRTTMFDRYTEEAKRAVFYAYIEAAHRKEDFISVGDLLLGISRDAKSRACQVARLRPEIVTIRAELGVPHLPITANPYLQREAEIPLDSDAKKVIRYAAQEANRDFSYWIDSDHLLRGVLRVSGTAKAALEACGIDLQSVRALYKRSRLDDPDAPVPRFAYIKTLVANGWTVGALIVLVFLLVAYLRNN